MMSRARTKRRLDEASWRAVMQRFAASASSVGEFCAREGLSDSAFYRWRARLATDRSAGVVARSTPRARMPLAASASSGFIDLGHLGPPSVPTRETGGGLELRLELGGGVVLHIGRR